jgi:2-aminoadipate transaminase
MDTSGARAMIEVEREGGAPVYRQVQERLRGLIRSGVLKPGQKLPPTRRMAGDLRVNRNTVVAAYAELEADGQVRSHVGRGTFVAVQEEAAGSAPAAVAQDFRWQAHLAPPAGDSSFSALLREVSPEETAVRWQFGVGFPPAEFYPVERLKTCFHALLSAQGGNILNYGPVQGLASLREQIAQRIRAEGGEASARGIFITSGSQQAIALAARALVEAGDVVAVEEPTYPGVLSVFRERKARILGIPVDREGLDLDAFEEMCRRRAPKLLYTIPDFQNPTGCTLGLDQREKLVRLAEKYGVPVLEDGSFRELRYRGEDLPPLKAFDRAGLVIHVNSVSKKIVPALRVGWAAVHPDLIERLSVLKSTEDLGTSTLCQALLEVFLVRGYYRAHLRRVRRAYRERLNAMWDAIARHFPAEVRVDMPEGGMFLWVTFPEYVDLGVVLAGSRRRGLVFCPGTLFYASGRGRNQMRLSFTAHSPAEIKSGMRLLGQVAAAAVGGKSRSGEAVKVPLV